MFKLDVARGRMLRIVGAVVMGFSVVMALLVIFVIPGACSFVGGLQLVILGFLFLGGMFAFLLGQWVLWKPRLQTALTAMVAMIARRF